MALKIVSNTKKFMQIVQFQFIIGAKNGYIKSCQRQTENSAYLMH